MHWRAIQAGCACGLLAAALAAQAADHPWVVPADGQPFQARFAGAGPAWELQFDKADKPRTLAADELVAWGTFVEPGRDPFVVLADGGLIVTENTHLEAEQVLAASDTFGKIALPIELVAGIVFRPPFEPAARDALLGRLTDASGNNDRVLLDNGDELVGTVTALDENRAVLRADAGPLEIKLDTLVAIVFDPSLVDRRKTSGLRAAVGFADGSRVTAIELTTQGELATLALAGGIELKAPTADIVALQMFGGRVEYLSDLKPSAYRHIPYLTLAWPYKEDRSVLGQQLRAGGRLYLKGLGMHSPSRLTYELDDSYRRFEALVAVDDEAGQRGSVAFRVFVDDGSGTWQPVAESTVLRGGDAPERLSVDVAGARRISLLVDFADRGDELDHADWLNARLVREQP